MAGFTTFNHEPEQYLFSYVLRSGNAPATREAISIFRRLLERVRAALACARVPVRLDGFAAPPVLRDRLMASLQRFTNNEV